MLEFYRRKPEIILKELGVDQSEGLSTDEARKRLAKFGKNTINTGKKINPFKLFASQFNDVLIIVLIIAAAVSFGLSLFNEEGRATEALLIFCLLYTSPSPRDRTRARMPSSA